MAGPRFAVGIDLGTSNTVVAAAPLDSQDAREAVARLAIVPIAQAIDERMREALPLLPSVLHAPLEGGDALAASALVEGERWVVGAAARRRAAEVMGRSVASAKSWLSHLRVDRRAPILPWGGQGEADAPKISPVDASAAILRHVRRAWDEQHPEAPLTAQSVVLTVPASFDESARALTLEAAVRAGFGGSELRLLEEPAAAFLAWIRRAGDAGLLELLGHGAREADAGEAEAFVLVCDVGGGTTDLSLLRVRPDPSEPAGVGIERVAVGEHLLLGGDNIDLAIAHALEPQLVEAPGARLAPSRFLQLVAAAREAKERMLADAAMAETTVVLLGSGGRLIGGARRAQLDRATLDRLIEPFFPSVALDEVRAQPPGRAGFVSLELPYARDPAITRHVARFLARHLPDGQRPLALLLNGGVFRSSQLAERMRAAVAHMLGRSVVALPHADPDLAVAEGAALSSLAALGRFRRLASGAARSYYLTIGAKDGRSLLCVLPRGTPARTRVALPDIGLALTVGKLARFPLSATTHGRVPEAGELRSLDAFGASDEHAELEVLPPLVTRMKPRGADEGPVSAHTPSIAPGSRGGERSRRAEQIAVGLEAELSEIGTLEIDLIDRSDPSRRHRLAFELGALEEGANADVEPATSPKLTRAIERVAQAFPPTNKLSGEIDPRLAKELFRDLEKQLGDRGGWPLEVVRPLFDALRAGSVHRRRSVEHERAFWSLAGYAFRPGFGAAGDDQRAVDLAALYAFGLYFPKEPNNHRAWWVAWRRAAGGLDEAAQSVVFDAIAPSIEPEEIGTGGGRKSSKLVRAEPFDEVLALAGALERLPLGKKERLMSWLLERTWTSKDAALYAAIGRVGARVPSYASAHYVVRPQLAEEALGVLARAPTEIGSVGFAIAQLARRTGDRALDVGDRARAEALTQLTRRRGKPEWERLIREVVVDEVSRREALGESLPLGLSLA